MHRASLVLVVNCSHSYFIGLVSVVRVSSFKNNWNLSLLLSCKLLLNFCFHQLIIHWLFFYFLFFHALRLLDKKSPFCHCRRCRNREAFSFHNFWHDSYLRHVGDLGVHIQSTPKGVGILVQLVTLSLFNQLFNSDFSLGKRF